MQGPEFDSRYPEQNKTKKNSHSLKFAIFKCTVSDVYLFIELLQKSVISGNILEMSFPGFRVTKFVEYKRSSYILNYGRNKMTLLPVSDCDDTGNLNTGACIL